MAREVSFELSVDSDASPERVWAVLMDVERWPEWTSSIRRIQRLEPGDLAPGKAVRIWQPGLLPAVWRVTELVPGERFTWSSRNLGLLSSADHRIDRRGPGASRVTHSVRHTGALVWCLHAWLSSVTKSYVTMEALGLKARCERR